MNPFNDAPLTIPNTESETPMTTETSTPAGDESESQRDPWGTPDNELGYLSEFIHLRDQDPLDHHIACVLREIGEQHAHWAGNCKGGDHMDTDHPCDEYERGLHLGIAWLKARIQYHEQR